MFCLLCGGLTTAVLRADDDGLPCLALQAKALDQAGLLSELPHPSLLVSNGKNAAVESIEPLVPSYI